MVAAAARHGVDAIEFQLVVADAVVVDSHSQDVLWVSFEFDVGNIAELTECAREGRLPVTAATLSDRLADTVAAAGYDAVTVGDFRGEVIRPEHLEVKCPGTGIELRHLDALGDPRARVGARRSSAPVALVSGP